MEIRLLLKCSLLLLFIGITNPLLITRVHGLGLSAGLLVFILLWSVSIVSLLLLTFQRYSHTKLVLSVLIVLSSVLSFNYYIVTKQYMEFYEFEAMLNAMSNASDALTAFEGLWLGFFSAALGLIALLLPSSKSLDVNRARLLLPVFLVLTLFIGILFVREGEGTKAMPVQLTPLAYSLVVLTEKLLSPMPVNMPKVLASKKQQAFSGDIVVVMDESVRGDFLDINHQGGVYTSLKDRSISIVNFGIAASATNCSDTSNLSLRRGVSKGNYLKDKDHNPSLWQFAKKAGYRTAYLDAQLTGGRLGNHMSESERNYIDIFYQVSDSVDGVMNKDLQVAKQLHGLLNNSTRDFIYINKMGAHFPYEGKYPQSEMIYKPVMESNQFQKSYPEPGELPHPNDYSKLMRLKFINSYKNALTWNIASFFQELTSEPKKQPYVLLYTSDHGQSFHDDGREGYGTHCSISHTDPEEGIVPLIVMSNEHVILDGFKSAAALNFNKVSHFNIAPTLYHLMGFNPKDGITTEKTMFEILNKKDQKFLSKYFVRFGSDPIWNSIEMSGRNSFDAWAGSH